MAEMNIGNAARSDLTNALKDYEVTPKAVDGVSGLIEVSWQNPNWNKQYGYFLDIEELRNAIYMKAIWNVGKGWTADSRTTIILKRISGWGKDTFDDILFNMLVTASIGGDAFAEQIRTENNLLINLKPLDSSSIKIIVDKNGIIDRYEQTTKIKDSEPVKTFKPHEIFHLTNFRIADQIHGLSDVDHVQDIINAEKESFKDVKRLMHTQARPLILWKLKTDDTTKIRSFIAKIDAARNLGEDMFIPDDENIVSSEVIQVDPSSVVLAWRTDVRNKFYRALGLPLTIFGGTTGTESGSKVEYLAHEQIFEYGQRRLEKQIEAQLGLKINLISPVTLLENLQTDENKDAQNALTFQQNDVTAGSGK